MLLGALRGGGNVALRIASAIFASVLILVLLGFGATPNASATHTSSSFTEGSYGMSVSMVPISSEEIPTTPAWSGDSIPSPVGDTQGSSVIIPDGLLHDPDPGRTDQPDQVSCSRTVTISGHFYGWDESNSVRPLSFATAFVMEVDWSQAPNVLRLLGTVLLDYDGYLTFGPICNLDGSDAGTLDVVVAIIPASSAARVVRYHLPNPQRAWQFESWLYSAWTPQFDNVPDGTFNLGRWAVPSEVNTRDALSVYSLWSGVLAGWDLSVNRLSLPYVPPQVEVHYLAPLIFDIFTGQYLEGVGEPFPHYMVAGSGCGWTKEDDLLNPYDIHKGHCADHWDDFWWQIHIDHQVVTRYPVAVNHLYGHYVMQRYHSPTTLPSGENWWYPSNHPTNWTQSSRYAGDFDEEMYCSSGPNYQLYCLFRHGYDLRNFDLTYANGIAWAEAFADVFALAAMETRPGGAPTSVFNFRSNPDDPENPDSPWWQNFETQSTSSQQGHLYRERTVGRALYDIMDANPDGLDTYAGGFSRIWKAFTQRPPNSLVDFWNSWFDLYHGEHLPSSCSFVNPILGAQESMRQNGFLSPETCLSTSGATKTSVSLSWTKADQSDFSKYEVHRSTSAGFTPSSTTRAAMISDQGTKAYTVGSLSCGTTYRFEVVVFDTSGFRTASNKVSRTTSSCSSGGGGGGGSPFVATWNGTAYELDNNLLPRSEDWSRHEFNVEDHYRLHTPLVPKDGVYSLQILEFEDEHTRLDTVRLLTVDHDGDYRLVLDRDGNLYTFEEWKPPKSAVDGYGRNHLGVLAAEDGFYYEGWRGDFLYLDFGKVHRAGARLLLKVDDSHIQKTSVTADVLVDGVWVRAGVVHDRANFHWEAVDLSPFVPSDGLVVRLGTTKYHKIDVAGLDVAPLQPVHVQEALLLTAVHSEGGDVLSPLLAADGQYVNITPGQQVTLAFDVPASLGEARSFVLVTEGWYTHTYRPFVGEDLTLDGLALGVEAVLAQETEVFFWDVNVVGLVWELGDGTVAEGWSVSHTYLQAGEYTIEIRVHYGDGHIVTFRRHIVVGP